MKLFPRGAIFGVSIFLNLITVANVHAAFPVKPKKNKIPIVEKPITTRSREEKVRRLKEHLVITIGAGVAFRMGVQQSQNNGYEGFQLMGYSSLIAGVGAVGTVLVIEIFRKKDRKK
jgi:hypothetical protein